MALLWIIFSAARTNDKTTADAVVFHYHWHFPAASEAMPPVPRTHLKRRRAKQCRRPHRSPPPSYRHTRATECARLLSVTTRRRLMAKPCTPQPIAQRVQLFKHQSRNVSLSLGDIKGVFSFAKENTPFVPCSANGAALPCPSAKIKKHHNLRCDALWSGRRGSLAALPRRDTHSGRQTPHRGVFSLRSRPVRPSARFVSKK